MSWREALHPRDGDGKFRGDGHGARAARGVHAALHARTVSQADFSGDGASGGEVADRAAHELAAAWQVSEADLDELIAEEGLHPERTDLPGKREAVARVLIHGWNGASGGPAATIAIDAAREHLGLPDHANEQAQRIRAWAKGRPGIDRALRSFGTTMYDQTQRWLAERGVTGIDAGRAGFSDDRQRPFTSWSLGHGGMRHETGRVERHEHIPARLIFSTPATGFGTLAESELVVLPGW